MSILDDEDILIDNIKIDINNPFKLIQTYVNKMVDNLSKKDYDNILNILYNIKIPEFHDFRLEWSISQYFCGDRSIQNSVTINLRIYNKYNNKHIGDLMSICFEEPDFWDEENRKFKIMVYLPKENSSLVLSNFKNRNKDRKKVEFFILKTVRDYKFGNSGYKNFYVLVYK
jgi:hypothetical protein